MIMSAVKISTRPADKSIGKPLTVEAATVGTFLLARYFDKRGLVHTEPLYSIGGTLYRDPKGAAWAESLQPLSEQLAAKVKLVAPTSVKAEVVRALKELGIASLLDKELDIAVAAEGVRDATKTTK